MKFKYLNQDSISDFVQKDSLPPIQIQVLEDNDDPKDLTGKSIYLIVNAINSDGTIGDNKVTSLFTITNAELGKAQYNWKITQTERDLDTSGNYAFDIVYHDEETAAITGVATADAGNSGDDSLVAAGTYTGTVDGVYTLEVTTAGAFGGTGVITVTTNDAETAYSEIVYPTSGVVFDVGTLGVNVSVSDGGDGLLTLGDKWTIDVTAMIPGNQYTLTRNYGTLTIREALA